MTIDRDRRRRMIVSMLLGGGLHWYDRLVLGLAPTFYFPLTEGAGTVLTEIVHGWNGAYSATGVTYGAAGPGDGRTAVAFDGSAGFGNLFTAGLSTGFMHSGVGTICLFYKAANWTAANGNVFRFQRDANNSVHVQQNNTSDRLETIYTAGGTSDSANESSGQTSTNYRHIAITWDITAGGSGGEFKLYINGAQVGVTATSLGTWGSTDLLNTGVCVGSQATTAGFLAGSYARLAGFPVALTAAQLAKLAMA